MTPLDLTARSPAAYRRARRDLADVDRVVLHQMGCSFAPDSPAWPRVRAHYVVRLDGSVLLLHRPDVQMRLGSGPWNATCITVEHEGNHPTRYDASGPVYWCPEQFGRDLPTEAQVRASRALLRVLAADLPALRLVAGHRLISAGKGGCPGPDLWREVGEWAIERLGLALAPTGPRGSDLPSSWRRAPTVADEQVAPTDRSHAGPDAPPVG